MDRSIKKAVQDCFRQGSLVLDENGTWDGGVKVDIGSDFEIPTEIITNILKGESPRGHLVGFLCNHLYESYYDEKYRYIINTIKEVFADNKPEEVLEWIYKHLYLEFSVDEIMERSLFNMAISINTGDWNYDYTLNKHLITGNFKDAYGAKGEIASILWLVRQQGYTDRDLFNAIESDNKIENKFLDSVVDELINITSSMNKLVFFKRMSLSEWEEIDEKKQDLIISKNTNTGLVDYWLGAGSIINIKLEKDVVIPYEQLEMRVDGSIGQYSVYDIYGHDFWS